LGFLRIIIPHFNQRGDLVWETDNYRQAYRSTKTSKISSWHVGWRDTYDVCWCGTNYLSVCHVAKEVFASRGPVF